MNKKYKKFFSKPYFSILFAIILGFFVGGIFLYCCNYNPIASYGALLRGAFSKPKYILDVFIQSTPIILTGLSVAFAFKSGLFNIGAEGQYIMGVVVATILGTQTQLPPVIHFLFILIMAMLISGLWGAIAGFLKVKFGINEVVTSIMLNWIAFYFYRYIFAKPWLKVRGLDASKAICESARGTLFKTDLNISFFIAIIAVLAIYYLHYKTTKGFEFRTVGQNPEAARFVGINVKNNTTLSMFIAGAIAGLSGALRLTCSEFRMPNLAEFEGYGLKGIYVALVANCSPIGCVFSGLFFSAIRYGSISMQTDVKTPCEIINILTGLIVFFISISIVYRRLIAKISKIRQEKDHE